MQRHRIITADQVATLVHRVRTGHTSDHPSQPLSISRQAATLVVEFVDDFLSTIFRIRPDYKYDLNFVGMVLSPPAGNVRAVTSPIPAEIADLIRKNGLATIMEAHRGHSTLVALPPAEVMSKATKYTSSDGHSIVLTEEAAIYVASCVEYLVTEVATAIYNHDFKTAIVARDVRAIFSVNDPELSKMYAFASPEKYKWTMETKNDRRNWNTPESGSPSTTPLSLPREWNTPLEERTSRIGWNDVKSTRTPHDFMEAFRNRKNGKTPVMYTNAGNSFFEDSNGRIPNSLLIALFKQGKPSAIRYRGMRLSDIYDQLDFMEVRRAFPDVNFGGYPDAEYQIPGPLLGYMPQRDVLVSTFTTHDRTIVVYFRVRKDSVVYLRSETIQSSGSGQLAIYSDKRYIWIRMR